MNDFDRQLIELISSLTDECQVLSFRLHVVDHHGRDLGIRVIRDGFAGLVDARGVEETFQALAERRFLPTNEALRVAGLQRISPRYQIAQLPGALGLEDDPNLIFRYAADDPAAIAEVRARHGVE